MATDWIPMESDPGVFTGLLQRFGVKGAQVEEIWTLDEAIFENLRPVHGLIFLFKYIDNEDPPNIVRDDRLQRIFFSKQVTDNACATHALLNVIMNCHHPDVDLGPQLTRLKESCMRVDSEMRGHIIGDSQTIRAAHNSMAPPTNMDGDDQTKANEDIYHFIGYTAIDGRVYEMDGSQDGPIDHGPVAPGQDWLQVVRPIIRQRMTMYNQDEVLFSLLAIVSNRKKILQRKIDELLNESPTNDIENEIRNLIMLIEYEDIKMSKYKQNSSQSPHSSTSSGSRDSPHSSNSSNSPHASISPHSRQS